MTKQLARILAAALLAPSVALAAGAQLTVQQVELNRARWPKARGYLNVTASSGAPMPIMAQELLKVYENGSKDSSKVLKLETLDASGLGASIVLVVQASGAMAPIQDELKKAVAGFVNSLGEKDQVAIVDYGESAETVAPFSEDKGEAAGKAGKMTFSGKSFLLYDGLAQAISLYATAAAPGKSHGGAGVQLPAAKAIILISDGRDNGSATDVEKVISDANKRRIPIFAVGYSEVERDAFANLETLARRTNGLFKSAGTVDDINKALTQIKDSILKIWVVEWKTELDHDGKDHKIDVAMENDVSTLKGSILLRTPDYIDWLKIGIITGVILLLAIAGVVIYVLTRPKPPPTRFCPACKRAQMPEWEVCLFCLKSAKARLTVQKGMAKGKQYPLVGKIVSMGSGPENSIRILDGAVSSKHAGVAIDDNKFEIVDLGSKNGVLVNGKKTPRRFLRNGDIITLGMTELKFESSVAAAEDEAED